MTLGDRTPSWRILAALALTVGAVSVVTGCSLIDDPAPATAPTVVSPVAPAPGETPFVPVLIPDGSAHDNLPLFEQVVASVWASDARTQGAAYIDALTDAGFDRSAMSLTKDLSTVGRPAETLQFAVAWGTEECLMGQVGPSTGEPVTLVMPQLAEGRCLIGDLRPIDW